MREYVYFFGVWACVCVCLCVCVCRCVCVCVHVCVCARDLPLQKWPLLPPPVAVRVMCARKREWVCVCVCVFMCLCVCA